MKILDDSDWDRFTVNLDIKLQQEKTPVCIICRDVHCSDDNHLADIDEYVTSILKAVDSSIKAITGVKEVKKPKAKALPEWIDVVKPFRDDAIFWRAIWKSAVSQLTQHYIKL